MKIVITGADGQLGRAIQENPCGHILIPLSHKLLDITDASAVSQAIEKLRPELILNAAAYNRVDEAETHCKEAFLVNESGPKCLSQQSARRGIPLVHVSTDYIFDGDKKTPYLEADAPNPLSVYGKSKLAGEEAVRKANPRHFIVRTAWLYGIHGNNFVKTIIEVSKKGNVRLVNDQFGSPTYVPHLVDNLWKLIATSRFGTYHIAGSGVTSWYELTLQLFNRMNIKSPLVAVSRSEFPCPAPRPAYSALATQYPEFSLPDWQAGLAEFCQKNKTSL